ncbi:HdeD family acid-resistance protein [Labrys wisconsinensis]|uniref:Uncharacterized membrane protein HdeD (DUF308 family) n=1 Tax=Labrys wisconsinensis TaxID=425677 RepID=A0ABU0J7L6_9HYPH|nr:DUF308 domain-containing protein [Labrys wisconsinensis]MDQ0469438.1 uncharacterized membrane protein HdeD (DUF308 family) [Labrys wisconsinensis]
MTASDAGSPATLVPPTWLRILLGLAFVVAGAFVLADLALATLASTLVIGGAAIAVGLFEIVHAFWSRGWGGFLWQILLGALYTVFGLMMVSQPLFGALVLTYVVGIVFLATGIVRIVIAVRHWRLAGWLMLLSGAFGILAGLVVLTEWPMSGAWVLGLLLGIDLLSHGVAWLTFAWLPLVGRA